MANAILHDIEAYYGTETRTSAWVEVTQAIINQFAEATMDPDWMHIDPERASRESPFGQTIAFGFWTISMLTYLQRSEHGAEYPPGVKYGFNYGFDRLRLMSPVPVGSRIRNHAKLLGAEEKCPGNILVRTENTIEIQGVEKPAMVAEWLAMLVTDVD